MEFRRSAIGLRRAFGSCTFTGLILLLALAGGLVRLGDAPSGFHRWREADTLMVSWNLCTGEADLLQPRVNARGTGTGITGQEFPLCNALIAGGWRILGWNHWWPHLVIVGFSLAGLVALHRLLRLAGAGPRHANLALAALACAPLWFFYGRKVIPDVPAAALALAGAACLMAWIRRPASWWWLAALPLLALAGVVKPLALAIGLPLAWWGVRQRGWSFVRDPRTILVAVGVLAALALWVAQVRTITDPQVAWYFTTAIDWRGSWQAIVSGAAPDRLLVQWPWQLWAGLPVSLAVLYTAWRGRTALAGACTLWLAGAFLVLLPFAVKFGPHDYYTIVAAVPFACLAGFGLATLAARPRWGVLVVALALLVQPFSSALRMHGRYGEPEDLPAARALAAGMIPRQDLVVVYGNSPGYVLYAIDRRGWWVETPSEVRRAIARPEARWLVVEDNHLGAAEVVGSLGLGTPTARWARCRIWRLPVRGQ